MCTLREFPDQATLTAALAQDVIRRLKEELSRQARAVLVVSGGRSPIPLFQALARQVLPWERVTVTLADERWVPPDHPDSNEALVRTHLLKGPAAAAQLVPLWSEAESPEAAAPIASAALAGLPHPFSHVLLGMGEDGHIASLFPGAEPDPSRLAAPVPPPDASPRVARLTLTPRVLNAAREILFLVLGADKHPALRRILAGDGSLPAARIDARPQSWYLCPALNDNTP